MYAVLLVSCGQTVSRSMPQFPLRCSSSSCVSCVAIGSDSSSHTCMPTA